MLDPENPEAEKLVPEVHSGRINHIHEKLRATGQAYSIADLLLFYSDLLAIEEIIDSGVLRTAGIEKALKVLHQDKERLQKIVLEQMCLTPMKRYKGLKALREMIRQILEEC